MSFLSAAKMAQSVFGQFRFCVERGQLENCSCTLQSDRSTGEHTFQRSFNNATTPAQTNAQVKILLHAVVVFFVCGRGEKLWERKRLLR